MRPFARLRPPQVGFFATIIRPPTDGGGVPLRRTNAGSCHTACNRQRWRSRFMGERRLSGACAGLQRATLHCARLTQSTMVQHRGETRVGDKLDQGAGVRGSELDRLGSSASSSKSTPTKMRYRRSPGPERQFSGRIPVDRNSRRPRPPLSHFVESHLSWPPGTLSPEL